MVQEEQKAEARREELRAKASLGGERRRLDKIFGVERASVGVAVPRAGGVLRACSQLGDEWGTAANVLRALPTCCQRAAGAAPGPQAKASERIMRITEEHERELAEQMAELDLVEYVQQ